MKRSKKLVFITSVIAAIMLLSAFGYAAWSQTLDLDGNVEAKGNFRLAYQKAEIIAISDSVGRYNGTATGYVNMMFGSPSERYGAYLKDAATGNMRLNVGTLAGPGAWIKVKVYIKNEGTVTAELKSGALDITPVIQNGLIIEPPDITGDSLAPGAVCAYEIVFRLHPDYEGENAIDETFAFNIKLNYDQVVIGGPSAPIHEHP